RRRFGEFPLGRAIAERGRVTKRADTPPDAGSLPPGLGLFVIGRPGTHHHLMTRFGEPGRQCLPYHPRTQDPISHSAVSRGCRITSQVRSLAVRSALCQPVANRTRKVRDVVGVAGRDEIAIDHDGHVIAPDAPVLLYDRPDYKVGVFAGEMESRE